MRFNTILKTLRLKEHMTQEQLGNRLGVTKVTISNYEKGTIEPDFQKLILLADVFDVSTDYLLGHSQADGILIDASGVDADGRDLIYDTIKSLKRMITG